jgi:peroxiredoxin
MIRHMLFVSAILFLNICFGQYDNDSNLLRINFNAESTAKINFRNFSDTILVSSTFGNIFPTDYIKGPKKQLFGDGTEYITLKIQIPQKVDLNFSGHRCDSSGVEADSNIPAKDFNITCFLVSFDTLTIDLDYAKGNQQNQSVNFYGKYAEISKYYQDKTNYFPGKNFNYMKGILANTLMDLDSFKNSIDSLTGIELNFLNDYCTENELPEWFTDYESSDINYFGYGIKISEPDLIKYFYDPTLQVQEDYYQFTKDLPLENEQAILSIYYFLCPLDYFNTIWARDKIKNLQGGEWNSSKSFIEYSTSQFSPYISDVLLAWFLDMKIERNQINEEDYRAITNSIKDSSINMYLETRYLQRETLKQGDEAPSFYLKNEDGKYLSSGSFRESILYISFWFSGCKPCIKEFPEENRLVDIFKDKKVKIISICMETEEENWRYMIQKYQLKTLNLYATGNWENILKENYDIGGFPHYVLIDKDGKIIENKCVRPSQGAEQMIRNVLNN